jgi:hypothetical protein
METIDITPKWKQVARVMLLVLDNPEATKESKEEVKQEFIRMAGLVDEMNEKLESENK